jgi:hypothetical protein
VLRKEIINTNPKQIHKSGVHKEAAQEVDRVVVVEEGEVQEARKAKEMTNLLGITAVAEIEMGLGQLPD